MFYSWRLLTLNWINICSKVFPPVKNSQCRTISLFAPRIVLMRLKKKIDQNILEEDMGIWLTSAQGLTLVTWNITPDTTAVRKSPNWVFSWCCLLCALYSERECGMCASRPPYPLLLIREFLKLCNFFYLSRTKQLCLHLTDPCTNVTFAVIYSIKKQFQCHWIIC